jgi:type II secretory pathway pseudopilin PulG
MLPKAGPNWRRAAGFTMVETVVALALCGLTISVFYASISQAIRLARTTRDTAVAAELMQQRVDSLRSQTPWSQVTTASSVSTLLSAASPVPADFPPATETMTIADYPADGASFSISRTSAGAMTTTGSSLAATQRCVQVTMQFSWTQPNRLPVTRTLSTILSKGGL